jgi:23S rRNA (adenine2503-C2)-methyltransferase
MQDITGLSFDELKQVLAKWGQPHFHAQQIFSWIYKKGIIEFDKMSDLSKDLRKHLKENFSICDLELEQLQKSLDGTQKFLFRLKDENFIEAVSIPTKKRLTGCISSQVGCKFACSFCASGLLGFKRNLNCSDIINEVLYLKNNSSGRLVTPLETIEQGKRTGVSLTGLTHIVFMGTGEPLDNYDNVLKAVRIINSDYGLNIGARRITISTCGVIPAIKRFSTEALQIELSVSLHSADDKIRCRLMPVNKIYPLKELILACRQYIEKTKRQLTFEYVMLKGINSHLQDAIKLSKILRELKCKVNLIPFNPVKEGQFHPPDKEEALLFKEQLLKSGINVTLRKPRGQDIEAACGQLRLRYAKK